MRQMMKEGLPVEWVKCNKCGHKFKTYSIHPICGRCHRRDIRWLNIPVKEDRPSKKGFAYA